ncbi:hypothetical protein RUND412_006273 [Rhizina undulata]
MTTRTVSKVFRIKDVPDISTVVDLTQILREKLSEADNEPIPAFLRDVANDKTESQKFYLQMGNKTLIIDINFYGFTQLYEVKGTWIAADIVAVTGLGGHAYGSWRGKQTKQMWLRDFLSQDSPKCRTMIYGYNTNLNSRGIHTLNDYKIEFLNEIAKVRNSEEQEIMRPIIFIGHSFGGIVIVQSLVEAATRKAEKEAFAGNSYLVAATCAVVFFGTPHRGISMEDVRKMLVDYDISNPRIGLLNEIKDELILEPYLQGFMKLAEGFKVVSFYERLQTAEVAKNSENRYDRTGNYKSTVDTDSALLHLPKNLEDTIPVNSDHTNMVKFDHKRDTTYEDVVKRVLKFVETAPDHVNTRFGALDAETSIFSSPAYPLRTGSWWKITLSTTSQQTNSIANSDEQKICKRIITSSDGQQAQKRIKLHGQTLFANSNISGNESLAPAANLSLEVFNDRPFEILEDVMQVDGYSEPNALSPNFQEYNVCIKLPFRRNPKFCGRVDILEKLKELLQAYNPSELRENKPEMQDTVQSDFRQTTAVLHGMGGAGKSQIALEFAYKFSHCYTSIFWIDAENVSRTAESAHQVAQQLIDHYTKKWRASPDYSEIANILGISGKIEASGGIKKSDTETAMKAVHNWLGKKENRRWLLLIDNHDNPESYLDKLIPMCDWGSVVVTTRLPELDSFGEGVEIEGIGLEAGLELLLGSSGKKRLKLNGSELGEAQNIVHTLCDLPLALEQAGAYIRSLQLSFSAYQKKLKEGMKVAFRKSLSGIGLSPEKTSVLTTWELSFQELSDNARHLLHICAFLSNEDIPDNLFRRGKSDIRWIEGDENNLDDAIQSLFRLSLAKRKESSDSFWIHPLVHAWSREHTDSTVQRESAQDTVMLVASAFHNKVAVEPQWRSHRDWEFPNRILTHLELCRGHILNYLSRTESIKTVDAWSGIASAFDYLRRYEEAGDLYQKVLQWKEKALGEDDPSTLRTIGIIANIFWKQGRPNEAFQWHERLLKQKEKVFGEDNLSALNSTHDIEMNVNIQGRFGSDAYEVLSYKYYPSELGAYSRHSPEIPAFELSEVIGQ